MSMGASVKLANLWRVVREVDLRNVRAEALAPFDLLIASPSVDLARDLRSALSPRGAASPHPWIHVATVDGPAPSATTPDAAIVLSGEVPLARDTAAFAEQLQRAGVAVVVAHISPAPTVKAPNVKGYVVAASVDAAGAAVIAAALLDVLPETRRLSFAHQLPPFRPALFERTIEETARANATYALTTGLAEVVPVLTAPLNFGDMVILMSYRLVLASGRDGEPRRLVTEILGVLGGGLLFRQIARQLVGLIPIAGLLPKVAIAYGGTWAIGRSIALWASEGRDVSVETVRSLSNEGLERGRAIARELLARRSPDSQSPGRWARLKANIPGLKRRHRP
jgi:uncharacterized protein (DUF697 family)